MFGCDGGSQKQNFEREKHRHRNQRFVSGEVMFVQKEITHPRDLDEHGADRAEDWQRSPVFAAGNGQQTDVKQGNVSEQSQRIILPGGQKDGGQKTSCDSEDRNHQRIHSYRQEKGCGRN